MKTKNNNCGFDISVNNGRTLKVELDTENKKIIFTTYDSNGNKERVQSLDEGETVLIYDFIVYTRDKNNGNIIF